MKRCRGRIRVCVLFFIVWMAECIDLVQMVIGNVTTLMYNDSVYESQFMEQHSAFKCSLKNIFTYKQSPQNLQSNTPYQLSIFGISQPTQISIFTEYGIISPNLNQTSCNNNCTVQIRNFCPNPVGIFKYFDTVYLNIQGMKTFNYNVICDQNFGTSTFQVGLLIIVVIFFIIIVLTAIYNRAWAFQMNGIEITYLYIVSYGVMEAIGGTLILLTPPAAQVVGDVIIWFIGSFGIIICVNEILYKFRIQALYKTLLNIKNFKIRITDVVSFFVALALLLAWFLSGKNWILNDFISLCTIIATIKIFKVTSFKKAIILYLIEITIEITFVILIDVLRQTSYEDFLLNDFNNPLQFQLPTINPVYGLKCSWLPLQVTIFPGILLSYFHRFDNSRNTKIYLITSSMAFFAGAMLWVMITSLSTINFPFQSVTQPAMLILVILFAYNRKQIQVLWNGKFYDPEFKNQQDHEQETYNYEMQSKRADINENFFEELRISKEYYERTSKQQGENEGHEKGKRENYQSNNDPNIIIVGFKSQQQQNDNI